MRKLALLFSIFLLASGTCLAQTSGFTYQGKLADAGAPATGPYDLTFKLFPIVSGGAQIGADVVRDDVQVTTGVFTVSLDFGSSPFTSDTARYLEIAVRPGASTGAFTTLVPRQPITSSPYSVSTIRAASADVATNALQLGGVTASQFVQTGDARLSDARTPTALSTNYIQNTTTPQASSNFNISGNGAANIFNAATQFNIGGSRILSNPGTSNLFAGVNSGSSNTTGGANSFFGFRSGQSNSTGGGNSFFGTSSGQSNSTSGGNSFFGTSSGQNTTSGANSFFGDNSGFANTDGIGNNFFGLQAGSNNTSGSNNTFIGAKGGLSNTVEDNNTFIGNQANGAAGITNATAIGIFASVTQSNSLVLGGINGFNFATADTNVGIGTRAPQARLDVIGTPSKLIRTESSSTQGTWINLTNTAGGRSWNIISSGTANGEGAGKLMFFDETTFATRMTIDENGHVVINELGAAGSDHLCRNASNQISSCSSSLRYKTNIKPFSNGLNFISRLRPIAFSWKDGGMKDVGFGAEDVARISPLLVTYNAKGEVEGVKYDRLSVIFVNAFKEQQEQIKLQQERVGRQQQQLEQQQKEIDSLKQIVCGLNPKAKICRQ